jgi:hypothetical protein
VVLVVLALLVVATTGLSASFLGGLAVFAPLDAPVAIELLTTRLSLNDGFTDIATSNIVVVRTDIKVIHVITQLHI